jgi:hypothetical protein
VAEDSGHGIRYLSQTEATKRTDISGLWPTIILTRPGVGGDRSSMYNSHSNEKRKSPMAVAGNPRIKTHLRKNSSDFEKEKRINHWHIRQKGLSVNFQFSNSDI